MAHQLRVWAVDNADEALQTRSEQSPARLAHPSSQASAVCASGAAVEPSGDGTIAQIGKTALLRCSDEQVKIRRKKRPCLQTAGAQVLRLLCRRAISWEGPQQQQRQRNKQCGLRFREIALSDWLVLMTSNSNLVPASHLCTLSLEIFKFGGHRIELRNRFHAGLEIRGQRKNIYALMHDSCLHGCDRPVDFCQDGVDLIRVSV